MATWGYTCPRAPATSRAPGYGDAPARTRLEDARGRHPKRGMTGLDYPGPVASIIACPSCGAKNRVSSIPRGTPRCARCKAALPWIVSADEGTFAEETTASVPVLVDFWAPWCGPCRMVEPVLEQLASERTGSLKVVRVNVDENPALASRFQAMSIPLLVTMREGQEVDRVVGALPKAQLESRLQAL